MKSLIAASFPLEGRRLIEASAGTGKTYTITSLYLRLLLGDTALDSGMGVPLAVNQILVLTFTIAATDELRQRVRDRIIEARKVFAAEPEVELQAEADSFIEELYARSTQKERDRKLLSNALQMMDEASIFTIHGFCARVLSEQSFETGALFNQSLDADKDLLLTTAAEDCFRSFIMPLPAQKQELALSLWPTPEKLLMAVRPFLQRFQASIIPPFADIDADLEDLLLDVKECKAMWLSDNIEQLIIDCNYKKNSTVVTRLSEVNSYCQGDSLAINVWEHWNSEKREKGARKAGTIEPTHKIFLLIDSIWARRHLGAQLEYNLWHQLIAKIQENLAKYKTQFSQFTLDDLLSEVHKALHEEPNALAQQLRYQWPVAMIDEFQDTDNLQYQIFEKIYPGQSKDELNKTGLFFIGDPKQAIYQFRGADIYTYINAKRAVDDEIFSLGTNWRSTLSMVAAVNHLFDQNDIFGDDKDIPFETVQASKANKDTKFTFEGEILHPICISPILREDITTDTSRRLCMEHAAEQITTLLNAAAKGTALVNGQPLKAGQIAILTRSRADADMARNALSARNIRSVYITLESVLGTDTAVDLKLILQAVIEPSKDRALRGALATNLMQCSASDIDALDQDLLLHQGVIEEFLTYRELWLSLGVAAMIERLIERRELGQRWLCQQDGERQLTNLRHLAEILQGQSQRSPGMHQLMNWFEREKKSSQSIAAEDQQLRLESDHHLVQIVTMHSAKGLEYDVVMVPIAGFSNRAMSKKSPLIFHQAVLQKDGNGDGNESEQFETIIDLACEDSSYALAQQERMDEDMRLLYVAITRARYQCYLGLPSFKNIENTAISRLLNIKGKASAEDKLAVLQSLPGDLFKITPLGDTEQSHYQAKETAIELAPPPPMPEIIDHWRVHSYTGLSRLIQTAEAPTLVESAHVEVTDPGFSDDDTSSSTENLANNNAEPLFSRFSFPRGPSVGVALHDVLETLAFDATPPQIELAAQRCLNKIGITTDLQSWLAVTCTWINDILHTPIGADHAFSLSDIKKTKRLNELEFFFPVIVTQAFLDCLQSEGYLQSNVRLSIHKLNGMMTGFIDLVVEQAGKFYLIDYKSNHLGEDDAAYQIDSLRESVTHHQYDLQYLIYCVALNRYLKQSLSDFSYEQHFGGVAYLFLRGMSGKTAAGIYFDRPTEALIEKLDALLSPPVAES